MANNDKQKKVPTPVSDLVEFVKALVRPYIICSSWTVVLMMWFTGEEVPPILLGVASAIAGEYILERAKKRWVGK